MIISSGVLVPAEICHLVGQLAAAEVGRERTTNPDVLRIVEEMLSVSVSGSGQNVDAWEPLPDAARRREVHPRTLRRWAEAGKVPARMHQGSSGHDRPPVFVTWGREASNIKVTNRGRLSAQGE